MNNLRRKIATGGVAAIVVIVILTICYGLSWIVTCGIIKLVRGSKKIIHTFQMMILQLNPCPVTQLYILLKISSN